MAAVAGLGWLRDPSNATTEMSSPSAVDRPIRPLPKRRLKARLSEEAADSIIYPPVPSSTSPAFESLDRNQRAVETNSKVPIPAPSVVNDGLPQHLRPTATNDGQSELDSDDGHQEGSISKQRSNWSNAAMSHSRSAAHYSAASSGDGYESFENTNNKKKRKIPQHQHASSGQFPDDHGSGLAMSPGAYQLDGTGQAEAAFSSNHAHSSANESVRSGSGSNWNDGSVANFSKEMKPVITTATSAARVPNSEAGVQPRSPMASVGAPKPDSKAVSSNNTRKTAPSRAPSKMQKQDNQSYDFTFERQSQSSNRLSQTPRPVGSVQTAQYINNARDAPPLASPPVSTVAPNEQRPNLHHTQQQHHTSHASTNPAPTVEQPPSPSRTEQYRIAAQDRRRSQRAINARQLREKKEVTLCEFCEFKAIWLYTPRFLIRRYEERDLKRRQDIENRRRLLEKAKAKSRKTKKSAKGQKAATASQQSQDPNQPMYDPAFDDGIAPEDAQSPGEEYFDDEFEENVTHQDDYGDDVYGGYPPPLEPLMHENVGRGNHRSPQHPAS